MAIFDEIVKRATAPELEKHERESKINYFTAMGKAAAHGYWDTYNRLINDVPAEEAIKLIVKSAERIPGEIHKAAEDLLKEKK